MDTARTMGAALLVFGVAAAAYAGATGGTKAVTAGVVAAALMLYLGIGLYSRSRTGEERLHEVADDSRSEFVDSTASYVAAAAAAVGFLGFAAASATDAGWKAQTVFGVVFLYSLTSVFYLRTDSGEDDSVVDDG